VKILAQDIRLVQNPALGALLQWRFSVSYVGARNDARPCPIILLFFVMPLLLHAETFSTLASTYRSSGLRLFAAKFAQAPTRRADVLLSLHERISDMRIVSLDAIRIGIATRLFTLDSERMSVLPLSQTPPQAGIPASVRSLMRNAEKVGAWCADLTLHEICIVLKLRL
jgi:ABC-3C biological conflict system middle component